MDSRRLGLQPMTLSILNKRTSCGTVAKQINMLGNGIGTVDHYCEKYIRKTPAQINTTFSCPSVCSGIWKCNGLWLDEETLEINMTINYKHKDLINGRLNFPALHSNMYQQRMILCFTMLSNHVKFNSKLIQI